MSSTTNKTWAEIASKTTKSAIKAPRQSNMDPRPITYHPLIPALVRSDIPCPRCKHKNHPFILDDLLEDDPRPGCPECQVCFPEKMGGTAVGKPVKSPPCKRALRVTSTSKSSPQMSAIQFGTFSIDDPSQTDDVELNTIELTPPQSPKRAPTDPNPNSLFFEKDEEEESSYATLIKGSVSDDTAADKRWPRPAIGSERGKGTF
jgi:hypothetical protein